MKYRVDYIQREMVLSGRVRTDMVCSRHFDTPSEASEFAREINEEHRVVALVIVEEPRGFVMPIDKYYAEKLKKL